MFSATEITYSRDRGLCLVSSGRPDSRLKDHLFQVDSGKYQGEPGQVGLVTGALKPLAEVVKIHVATFKRGQRCVPDNFKGRLQFSR